MDYVRNKLEIFGSTLSIRGIKIPTNVTWNRE